MTVSRVRLLITDKHILPLVCAVEMACVTMPACRATPSTAAPITAYTWAVVDVRAIPRRDGEKAHRRTHDASQTVSEEEALTAKLTLLDDLIMQDILLAKARA